MSRPWDRHWTALREQVRANPRLRWALPLVAILLLAFVWQGLETARIGAQKRAIAKEADLRRIRALQGQTVWFERADQAEALLAFLHSEMPTASTPGMAQAATQTWLRGIANAVPDPDKVRVTVESSSEVAELPGVLRVKATISGGASPRQALYVVRQIEESRNLAVIETATIRGDENSLFTLSMNVYYRMTDGAAEPAPADPAPPTQPGAGR